jgi:hypothetical protein
MVGLPIRRVLFSQPHWTSRLTAYLPSLVRRHGMPQRLPRNSLQHDLCRIQAQIPNVRDRFVCSLLESQLSRLNRYMYLGCPGAGKGTLCSKLAAEYNGRHLSVGDLLRATILDEESTERRELTPYIRSGSLVPPAMLLGVLRRSIAQNIHETPLFLLIDGFP